MKKKLNLWVFQNGSPRQRRGNGKKKKIGMGGIWHVTLWLEEQWWWWWGGGPPPPHHHHRRFMVVTEEWGRTRRGRKKSGKTAGFQKTTDGLFVHCHNQKRGGSQLPGPAQHRWRPRRAVKRTLPAQRQSNSSATTSFQSFLGNPAGGRRARGDT